VSFVKTWLNRSGWSLWKDSAVADKQREFEVLFREHSGFVRKTAYWIVGPDHAEDLLQEVFIKLWNSIDQFRGESTLRTWIYRVTTNMSFDFLRRLKSRQVPLDFSITDEQSGPDQQVETRQLIRQGIEALPETHRTVFVLFYQMELSAEEVAAAVGIPLGTVKSRLHHARNLFRDFMRAAGCDYES